MSDDPLHSVGRGPRTAVGQWQLGRLRRLVLKELREILRDRRTIITLVVMPLLIYPLLAIVFQRFLVTSLSVNQDTNYVVGVDSLIGRQILENQLRVGDAALAARRQREDDNADARKKGDSTGKDGHPQISLAPSQEVAEPTIMLEALPARISSAS